MDNKLENTSVELGRVAKNWYFAHMVNSSYYPQSHEVSETMYNWPRSVNENDQELYFRYLSKLLS